MSRCRFLLRPVLILMIAAMLATTASGCSGSRTSSASGEGDDLQILTSFLPMYIFTANLVQGVEGVTLSNLAAPDVGCLHDYQLLPTDMIKLEQTDIFIFNGAGMEGFIAQLADARQNMTMVEASSGIDLLKMPDGTDNAHVWLSIPLAIRQVRNISAGLQKADPVHAVQYHTNETAYISKLEALDSDYRAGLADLKHRSIITFHEAFPYLAAEYGLEIAAVIEREPGSEPSAAELAETIDLIREKGIPALFAEPQYSTRIAETIANETGARLFSLDPIVTGDAEAGTYELKMRENLLVLQTALDG